MFKNILLRTGASAVQSGSSSATEPACSCYVFTIKKSGTHLLKNVLEELGMTCIDRLGYFEEPLPTNLLQSGTSFALSHFRPSQALRGMCQNGEARIIMNLRDPRGIFLSMIDFFDWRMPLAASEWWPVRFRRESFKHSCATREQLAEAILDDELHDDDPFTPWLNLRQSMAIFHNPSVLKIRYEDFFPEGRGDSETNPVLRICRYLSLPEPSNAEAMLALAKSHESPTLNAGIPERWRRELSPTLLRAFMEKHGDLVRKLGYPED
jgi:hypothetical protein